MRSSGWSGRRIGIANPAELVGVEDPLDGADLPVLVQIDRPGHVRLSFGGPRDEARLLVELDNLEGAPGESEQGRTDLAEESQNPVPSPNRVTGRLAGRSAVGDQDSAGDGRVSSASRADYAAAAVAVLTGTGHEGQAYELGGDHAWTYPELATAAATIVGRDVTYQDLAPDQHKQALLDAGLPEPVADFLVATDQAIAQGLLEDHTGTLARLIGRPTTPFVETLAAGHKSASNA